MKKIYILGAGPGHPDLILNKSKELAENSDVVVINKRLEKCFKSLNQTIELTANFDQVFDQVSEALKSFNVISFIVSGDPNLFSLTNIIIRKFKNDAEIEIVPGISTLNYFYSKLKRPLNDVQLISFHGRDFDLEKIPKEKEIAVFLDNKSLNKIAKYYLESDKYFILGENLSYKDEKITYGKPADFLNYSSKNLTILSIINSKNELY